MTHIEPFLVILIFCNSVFINNTLNNIPKKQKKHFLFGD